MYLFCQIWFKLVIVFLTAITITNWIRDDKYKNDWIVDWIEEVKTAYDPMKNNMN